MKKVNLNIERLFKAPYPTLGDTCEYYDNVYYTAFDLKSIEQQMDISKPKIIKWYRETLIEFIGYLDNSYKSKHSYLIDKVYLKKLQNATKLIIEETAELLSKEYPEYLI